MSRRRKSDGAEAPGQDSFLDVVANLVGVMIILVMVVGTQAKSAISAVSAAPLVAETPAIDSAELQEAGKALATAERGILEVKSELAKQDFEIEYRRRERDRAQLIVSAVEQELAARREKLDAESRSSYDRTVAENDAQAEANRLQREIEALKAGRRDAEVLKHYPTPIAKTVFGGEVHFRLAEDRITPVPFDRFVALLKDDVPRQVHKLKASDRMTESLGPVEGFRMRYTLIKEAVLVPGGGGARQERASLEQFQLFPIANDLGEPISEALAPNSVFRTVLAQHDPKKFTVTLWVYPESFGRYREVRELLLKLGYTSAARPMPEGHPIGGSPEGSRSASQ